MSDEISKVLYVISRAPYSNSSGVEALDAIMIGASFELDVSVLFLNDGVFQLKKGQNAAGSGLKQFTKTYRALNDFGVDSLYVQDQSLESRGLTKGDLMVSVSVIDSQAIAKLLAEQVRVLTF